MRHGSCYRDIVEGRAGNPFGPKQSKGIERSSAGCQDRIDMVHSFQIVSKRDAQDIHGAYSVDGWQWIDAERNTIVSLDFLLFSLKLLRLTQTSMFRSSAWTVSLFITKVLSLTKLA